VFESRVLRGIRVFGPNMEEIRDGQRKLHQEQHNSYSSPDIIRMIESRRMRYAEYVARIG
jgi:hypothetical protein